MRYPKSEEHKQKLSIAKLGKKVHQSEELKLKRSLQTSKPTLITFPDGHTEIVDRLRTFCIENGLSIDMMSAIRGGRFKNKHKGYWCELVSP